MTSDELNEEYMNMCGEQDDCDNCKYGKFHCQLSFGYSKGRADKYQEIISEYMLLTEKQVAEIRADAIEEFVEDIINKINFEEKWLLDCKSNNADTNIMFSALRTFVENLKERNND